MFCIRYDLRCYASHDKNPHPQSHSNQLLLPILDQQPTPLPVLMQSPGSSANALPRALLFEQLTNKPTYPDNSSQWIINHH